MSTLARINQIFSFTKVASSPIEIVKLLVLGFARGHTFDSPDLISKIGRLLFSEITVKPKNLGKLQAQLKLTDLGHLISFEEIFLENCYDLKLIPFNPEVILDCGTHIGFFSLLARYTYPEAKIIAFEPNPENIKLIKEQIEINQLDISLIEAAISVEEGESWFQADYSNTGSLHTDNSKLASSYRVPVIDFPQFVSQLNCESLLLKVDIEGEEVKVLPALMPYLPTKCGIFFESHGEGDSWEKLIQPLVASGFQVQQIRSRGSFIDALALRI
ncbi:MAG: FkbM family methyltransferase [Scytonematopsis contorta HA4267-MV1]|jgi:FkbM family methyltransferase|nr:FkbM family methyltransferase [Scytonematopsis contorta HA4267-MV1]